MNSVILTKNRMEAHVGSPRMLNPKLLISREGGFRFSLILGSTWLALLAISGGATVFGGVEFHVSGEVETQTLGVGLGVQREEFEVFVRDDNWLIKIHQKAQAPTYSNAMLLDYYAFNVGSNIYTIAHAQDESGVLSRLLANPETPESWKQHPEEIPISMAWIERASVPHADARFSLPMIFYAFCSRHYLDSLKENRLEPPYFVDGRLYSYDEGATNVAAHIQRSQTAPFLPERIAFLHGNKWLAGPGDWMDLPVHWHGFTNAEYIVASFTNVGDMRMRLPAQFDLVIYDAFETNGNHLATKPETHVRGRISSATDRYERRLDDLKIPVKGYTTFTDKRFMGELPGFSVRYVTNKWLGEDEVVNLSAYNSAKREYDLMMQRTKQLGSGEISTRIRVLIWVLLTFSAVFVCLIAKKVWSPTKN